MTKSDLEEDGDLVKGGDSETRSGRVFRSSERKLVRVFRQSPTAKLLSKAEEDPSEPSHVTKEAFTFDLLLHSAHGVTSPACSNATENSEDPRQGEDRSSSFQTNGKTNQKPEEAQ